MTRHRYTKLGFDFPLANLPLIEASAFELIFMREDDQASPKAYSTVYQRVVACVAGSFYSSERRADWGGILLPNSPAALSNR